MAQRLLRSLGLRTGALLQVLQVRPQPFPTLHVPHPGSLQCLPALVSRRGHGHVDPMRSVIAYTLSTSDPRHHFRCISSFSWFALANLWLTFSWVIVRWWILRDCVARSLLPPLCPSAALSSNCYRESKRVSLHTHRTMLTTFPLFHRTCTTIQEPDSEGSRLHLRHRRHHPLGQ